MGFKKHNWIRYGRAGDTAQITIRDSAGGKVDEFRYNIIDKKAEKAIANILKRTYNINLSPEIKSEDSINMKKEKDWLN